MYLSIMLVYETKLNKNEIYYIKIRVIIVGRYLGTVENITGRILY